MSLKIEDLETFKRHRYAVSESLSTDIVGRDREIEEISSKIDSVYCLTITGPAGVGKSRLAVAAIEHYCANHTDFEVLCTKSFSDYISALDEAIEEGRKYVIFIDDANTYPRLIELLEFLKYRNQEGNIKAILTVRDYLKGCLDSDIYMEFYEVKPLNDKSIEDALVKNTTIRNEDWLKQIAKIANGNIRVAFLAANEAIKNNKSLGSIYNQKDVLNRFYKDEISKIDHSESLLITAGIIAFFKSIYLEQLFYIVPILKSVNLSKKSFIENVNILIKMEIVDNYHDVVKIADQCFADFLLNYTIVEKRYLKIKDLLLVGFKYYKERIVESIHTILHVYNTEEFVDHLRKEVTDACNNLEDDVSLKHGIESCFAQVIPEYVSREYIEGVEKYSDQKDIKWLINVFSGLAFSNYNEIANKGVLKLLKKTKNKTKEVYDAIKNTYEMRAERANERFQYQIALIKELQNGGLYNDEFNALVSSYLNFRFSYSCFTSKREMMHYTFSVDDNTAGILELRSACWGYLFNCELSKAIDSIMDFANRHYIERNLEIIKNDLRCINTYLCEHDQSGFLNSVLYVKFIDEAKEYCFTDLLTANKKYLDFLDIVFERKLLGKNYEGYEARYKNRVTDYYNLHKDDIYDILNETDLFLNKYYKYQKTRLVNALVEVVDKFSNALFFLCTKNGIFPHLVIEEFLKNRNLDEVYALINQIDDETIKDEYLYNFYSYLSKENIEKDYGFIGWINSKGDFKTNRTYHRDAVSLNNIAEKCGLDYVALLKKLYSKEKYNKFIAKAYLSYLIDNVETFKELLSLNQNLAIKIYEFLIANGEKDYESSVLIEILDVKRSYIKVFAKAFIKEEYYNDCNLDFIFEKEYCDSFFNECMKVMLSQKTNSASSKLRILISKNINQPNMERWIEKYIESNYKEDNVIELFFQALSEIDHQHKNAYLVLYYQKGHDINVLRQAILNKSHSYSNAKEHFGDEIKWLETLKKSLLNWNNTEEVKFIDTVIDDYKVQIKNDEIESLVDYGNQNILNELRERDLKTEVFLKDAFELYQSDEKFRDMLSSGYLSYKDGSFVNGKNDPVKFIEKLKDKKIISVEIKPVDEVGRLDYEQYLSSMKSIAKEFDNPKLASLNDYLNALIDERGWKAQEFKENTFLSRDIFSKIRNNKKNKMDKKTLVQILIGLQVSKRERDYLLELNQTNLSKYVKEDVLYSFILDAKLDIGVADELLRDIGEDGF